MLGVLLSRGGPCPTQCASQPGADNGRAHHVRHLDNAPPRNMCARRRIQTQTVGGIFVGFLFRADYLILVARTVASEGVRFSNDNRADTSSEEFLRFRNTFQIILMVKIH